MNPLRWVRWKVVGVLAALVLAVYFLGLDSIALSRVNSAGEESSAATWSVRDLALGLLAGRAEFLDLLVNTPDGGQAAEPSAGSGNRVFNAAAVKVDLSTGAMLSRRFVVEQVLLDAPRLFVKRQEDGSLNVGELGGEPEVEPEEPAPEEEPRDWLETARKWYRRIQKIREWRAGKDEEEPEEREEEGEAPWSVDYSRGVEYPFEVRPTFEIREIVTQNLTIDFSDASSEATIPSLEEGTLRVRHITSRPSAQSEATAFELSGKMGSSTISVEGTVDLRGEGATFDLQAVLASLPASLIEKFVGPSLPVTLESGTISVDTRVLLAGRDTLEVVPRLIFQDIVLEPKDPDGKIAGFEASRFTKAFNEASRELGTLEISDLRITGSLASPKFEWGDTVRNLVVSGAKAFARKQAEAALDEVKSRAGELLDRGIEGLPPEQKDRIKESIEKTDIKKIEKGLEGIFGGGSKGAQEDEE